MKQYNSFLTLVNISPCLREINVLLLKKYGIGLSRIYFSRYTIRPKVFKTVDMNFELPIPIPLAPFNVVQKALVHKQYSD